MCYSYLSFVLFYPLTTTKKAQKVGKDGKDRDIDGHVGGCVHYKLSYFVAVRPKNSCAEFSGHMPKISTEPHAHDMKRSSQAFPLSASKRVYTTCYLALYLTWMQIIQEYKRW